MRAFFTKKVFKSVIRYTALLFLLLLCVSTSYEVFNFDLEQAAEQEITDAVKQMFFERNKAIINGDLKLIENMYDISTKYGNWAYQHELTKVKYIHNWEQKQGVEFTDIIPTVVVRSVKPKDGKYTVNLLCSTEYKYSYENEPEVSNSLRIGTYHVLDVMQVNEEWKITREWYKDPFEDILNLGKLKVDSIKEFILSQGPRDFSNIGERRKAAVEYADKYGFKYNKKYRNYNSRGGDCANFASQILHEGGKFRKTHMWNYDSKGATRAWVNAGGFKNYMIGSGRASLIAYGSYEKVYKASYKLLPGDFIAYEKNGDITHISVVTGADSKGYTLVSCHNTDRNRVPWDLGWSSSKIKFWLIRVHF